MTTRRKSRAVRFLEELTGGPLNLPGLLDAIREGEGWSKAELARRLGVSRAHLGDIIHRRKSVSPERAARFAQVLGYSERQFVRLALQQMLDTAGLRLRVEIEAA